jgi:hypothetical protein
MTTSRCSAAALTSRQELLRAVLVAIALCATLSTRAWGICLDNCIPCSPCNPDSVCYDPCGNPSNWCYASSGCGGPVCSECNPASSCYNPCSLSCYDTATCGAGPTDPSPIYCGAFSDGEPAEALMNLGFASVVEENAPADTYHGFFTLCVDIPPSGQTRTLFAGIDDSAEINHGIASSAIRNFGLTSATMTGPSLSDKDRRAITNCVQQMVSAAMSGSSNTISVTNTCPLAHSHEPFARVILGNPSSNLTTALGGDDAASAVLPDCRPRRNGVAIVDATRNRNNRHRCETIVHEFFHTLGLVHVQDRPAGFTPDIMQNPAVAGQRYEPTDTDNQTKDLPRCAQNQNTRKKVQEAVAKLVQPVCPDGRCEPAKDETCQTCDLDCCGGEALCGDGSCNGAETCDWCEADCGPCGSGGPTGGGPSGGGPATICCEADGFSSCMFIPCGPGWRCINNSCFPGCATDADCAFLCDGPEGGLCQCRSGQCTRTSSCVCGCTGPLCCPPNDPRCAGANDPPPGGSSGDPVWDWCVNDVCRGDWDCIYDCWAFFAS